MFVVSASSADYFFQPSIDALLPQYTNVDSSGNIRFVYTGSVDSAAIPQAGQNVLFYNV